MVDHLYPHYHRSYFVPNRNDRCSHPPNRNQTLIADSSTGGGHDMVRSVLSTLLRPTDGIHLATELEGRRRA